MRKSILEQNGLFVLAIAASVVAVALVWLYLIPGQASLDSAYGDQIELTDANDKYNVNMYMQYMPDKEGLLTFGDVRSSSYASEFKPALGQAAFGLSANTYWMKVTITNNSSKERWMVRLSNSIVDSLDVYVDPASAIAGRSLSAPDEIADHYLTYAIYLPAQAPVTLYMRASTGGSMIVPLELIDEHVFREQIRNEYLFFGLYYGFVLLMFAYMFALYFFTRAISYLYYSLYLSCFAISQLIWNGLVSELLGEDHWMLALLLRVLENYEGMFLFSFILCLLFAQLFLGQMLKLETYAPRMTILLKTLGILSPLMLVGLLLHLPGFATVAIYYEVAVVIVLTWATCLSVYRGNRAARYIVLALISLLGLAAPAVMYTYALMEFNVLAHYGYQIGSIAEFIILSLALSYQWREHQMEKEAAQQQMIASQERLVKTLERWNAELEHTVNVRTEKLVKSRRARAELLQNISHDIRSPLTVVQGGIRAMLLGIRVEPGDGNKHLDKIYDKVLYINKFIDDLFQLSRFEEDDVSESLEPVRARGWLEEEFISLAHDIRLTGRTCVYSLAADDRSVIRIDRHALRRALSNLVDNACKYSSAGSRVSLEATFRPESLQVTVQDRGQGIAAEYLERIFERSDRGGKTGDSADGSGLGLAIVKDIIERHHGTVWVESEQGSGSLFCFTLPAHYVETQDK